MSDVIAFPARPEQPRTVLTLHDEPGDYPEQLHKPIGRVLEGLESLLAHSEPLAASILFDVIQRLPRARQAEIASLLGQGAA